MHQLISHQNRQGKTRLSKWYAPYDDDEKVRHVPLSTFIHDYPQPLLISTPTLQVRLRGEVHRLIAPRDQKYQSNFVEVRPGDNVALPPCHR